jgi:hypothetical protein
MLGSANASVWDFLARSGPEDGLKAVPLGRDSSASLTGGQDWGITREGAPAAADLYYKDFSETQRFISMVESDSCVGPAPRGSHSLFPAPPGRHLFLNTHTHLAPLQFARRPRCLRAQAREPDPDWPAREQKPVRAD